METGGLDGTGVFHDHKRIVTIDGAGNVDDFVRFDFVGNIGEKPDNFPVNFTIPVIAPPTFGAFGGHLVFAHGRGAMAISPQGDVVPFFNVRNQFPLGGEFDIVFGAAFAPSDFGEAGGMLLLSDASPNGVTINDEALILLVDSSGVATVFASIPLSQQQIDARIGLRQMAFVPDGFGDLSGLLLVSVSGGVGGGGAIGQVVALNEDGEIAKVLRVGTHIDKFDPRGFFFTEDGLILISDASDPILSARIEDFVNYVVPEPTSVGLAAIAFLSFVACWRRRCR